MISSTQTVRDLRRLNRQKVLQLAYFNAPISRLEISERSGLSPATVTNLVTDLLADGVLSELGVQESQGGRPRTILNINPKHGYFVGVEVGETHIHTELFDLKLTKLHETHQALAPDDNQPGQVAEVIVANIEKLLRESGVTTTKVLGIGIGVPGIVDHRVGVSVFAPNWQWHDVALVDMLASQFNVPIYIDNGAQTMALAEKWFGAGKEVENLAVLLIATGVGAGIVTQGQLYRGTTNSAGEWGHTCLQIDGRPCRCGSRGCLEAYVGAPGIISRLRELDANSPLLKHERQQDVIAGLYQAAQQGDPTATKVMDETIHYLGAGIANIINLFNPQVIALGGWSGLMLGSQFLDALLPYIEHYALRPPYSATKIKLCSLGEDAVSIGAASLALEEFLKA